jgi:hypothetical protein
MTPLVQHIQNFENDGKWFQSHLDELRKEYVNEFVAVERGDVVTSGKTVDSVLKKLRKIKKDPRFVLIEFVPEKGKKLLF